jgi:hypothetical protein
MWLVCCLQAGKYERAISLLLKHGWWERLLSLMRALDATKDAQPLKAAVAAFNQAGTGTKQLLPSAVAHQLIMFAAHPPHPPDCRPYGIAFWQLHMTVLLCTASHTANTGASICVSAFTIKLNERVATSCRAHTLTMPLCDTLMLLHGTSRHV